MRKYRKPYRVKKKKSIFRNRFFWLGILSLIIFGGFFYLICFASTFQIREIKVSGNQKVPTLAIENIIQNQIIKKITFFSTKSIFLVNLNQINEALLDIFPQIAQANLTREFPNILSIQIEERKPVAIFCHTTTDYPNCFYIDKEGIVFESNVTRKGNVTFKKGDLNSEIKLGEKVIDETLISKILEIESKLRGDLKILSEEILVVSAERINVKTSEGWEIYLNPQGDIAWQLTKLRVVLEEEIPPENRQNLEYIELRFGNLAPYKYQEK